MTIREGIGLIGLLIASITPPLLYIYFKNNNFHILSIILIVLTALSLIFFYSWHRAAEIKKPANNQKNRNFRKILKNPRVKLFFTSYFFNSFATSIPATIIIFYVRDYLNAESYLGLFLLIYFLSGAASMPLWKYLSNKFSSIYSWFLSMIFAFLSFIWAFFLEPNNIIGFFIICLLSGIAVGANLALPSAIIAEDINSNNNQDYASSYYSISNFLSKFALAIASGVSLPILGFLGYVPGIARNDVLLPFVYAILPCCILLISIYLTSKLLNKSSI
jgi:Na+/melibiose symporter-like transporter